MQSQRQPDKGGRNAGRLVGRRLVSGFSLVELIVTLIVLAIVAAVALPSFTGLINGGRVTGAANEVVAGIQFARSEAIRRNANTSFCQSSNSTTCSNASPWQGWIVTADLDRDGVSDANEVVRAGTFRNPVQIKTSSNLTNNRLIFAADGLAYDGNRLVRGNIRVCMPNDNPETNARDVRIQVGGTVSIGDPANVGISCPQPGN